MNETTPITPGSGWKTLMERPPEHAHTVQIYSDLAFLGGVVSHYASAGLAAGEAVVLVVVPEHVSLFLTRLGAAGLDVAALRRNGQLVLLDAHDLLARIIANGVPSAALFGPLLTDIIERARARYPRVRLYGEMVNVLWGRGELSAAIALEGLWNDLGRQHAFSLHCAYAMDNFDAAAHCGALHDIHHAHSHLIPADDYGRLDAAVNRALADVLGPSVAVVMRTTLAARQRTGAAMPPAQAALLNLSDVLPSAAYAVLSRARRYYAGAEPITAL
jgi:hypothetical protein